MSHPLAVDLDHVLAHTGGLWDGLRGGRLFITGGTGFFGKWLLETFLWANDRLHLGARATVLTRSPATFRHQHPHLAENPAVRLHEGDVRTFDFPAGPFSHVIHAATPSSTSLSEPDPQKLLTIIVEGTRRTLEFARQAGCPNYLLTSSGAVYGWQPPDLLQVSEEHAVAANQLDLPLSVPDAYRDGKRWAELQCEVYRDRFGLATKIARGFAFVGPYLPMDAHLAIGNFIRDGMSGPIHVKGDGTPYRSYLYAADLAIWLWTILLRGEPGRAYNVGSEEALSIAELARKIADYFHTDVQIAGQPDPAKPAERYVPSTQRAQRELGLQTWIGLDQAIDRTVRWVTHH